MQSLTCLVCLYSVREMWCKADIKVSNLTLQGKIVNVMAEIIFDMRYHPAIDVTFKVPIILLKDVYVALCICP